MIAWTIHKHTKKMSANLDRGTSLNNDIDVQVKTAQNDNGETKREGKAEATQFAESHGSQIECLERMPIYTSDMWIALWSIRVTRLSTLCLPERGSGRGACVSGQSMTIISKTSLEERRHPFKIALSQ